MPTICSKPLKQSPFTSHRDPTTGRWIVVVDTYLNTCKTEKEESAR